MENAVPILRPAPFLAIIVPCHNEQETLPRTMRTLENLLNDMKGRGEIRPESIICYVDDGSTDSTWNLIVNRHQFDPFCRGLSFTANAGHQMALWAGLEEARRLGADCAISLDADLQDDPSVIGEMVAKWTQGYDIVYGVRKTRDSDTAFKRCTAHLFYSFLNKLNMNIIPDHADYRLLGKLPLEALRNFEERNLFLRGLIPGMGFKSTRVYYKRAARQAGESKYNLRKMLSFAWTGITSTSVAPLRVAGLLSLICVLLTLLLGVYQIFKWAGGENIPGWTSLFLLALFLGAMQLFCLAVIGEYIAKIYTEVRRRPRYIIRHRL